MTDALALFEAKALDTFSDEDIRTLKRQLKCENCTRDEWRMLELMSTAYGLSPFLRQIWLVPSIGVFVGHGGFLTIAHRSGRFGGMVTKSYDEAGNIYQGGGHPAYSMCRVWLKDAPEPVTKTVFWDEFGAPKYGQGGSWDKMPAYMLEKVAEVHALKRAFSISGVYCPEEMGFDEEEVIPPASVDGQPVEVTRIKHEETPAEAHADICPQCGKPSMIPIERNKIQAAFDEFRLGAIPEGFCRACTDALYRKLMDIEKGGR